MGKLKRLVGRVILVCIGIVFSLLLIEAGLRLFPRDRLNAIIERTSQRLQLYRLDPRIGWTLNPDAQSVYTTREDLEIPITINSLGLRDTEHTYEKPANVFRILVLGDSFSEALDVYLEESFPYRVEECLNQQLTQPVEVINGGVSGYNTADEYLFYRNEGIKYNPDLVILVLYVGNDFSGLERTIQERLVAGFGGYRFKLENEQLSKTWISWESPNDDETSSIVLMLRQHSLLYRVLAHPESKIYHFYKASMGRWYQPDLQDSQPPLEWKYYIHAHEFPESPSVPQKTKDIWNVFQIIVKQLNELIVTDGRQLVTIILPADYQASKRARERVTGQILQAYREEIEDMDWRIDEPNKTIRQVMTSEFIPTLDLLPYFLSHEEAGEAPLYFDGFSDEHLNRRGQKLIADVMCDWLIRNNSVSLPRRQ